MDTSFCETRINAIHWTRNKLYFKTWLCKTQTTKKQKQTKTNTRNKAIQQTNKQTTANHKKASCL